MMARPNRVMPERHPPSRLTSRLRDCWIDIEAELKVMKSTERTVQPEQQKITPGVTQEFAKASMMWNMTGLSDRVLQQMPMGMTWEAWTEQ